MAILVGWSLASISGLEGMRSPARMLSCGVGGSRRWDRKALSRSAPCASASTPFASILGKNSGSGKEDLTDYALVREMFTKFQPDAVVHLGECPSAPYSMVDRDHAVFVQTNNIVSTFNFLFAIRSLSPETHLVKLGTMGEYGTPNVEIPEGFFEIEYGGRADVLPFPRQPGSRYHWSKVHGPRSRQQRGKRMSNLASDLRWS
jgi:UDP-sulfoquinovose synthase